MLQAFLLLCQSRKAFVSITSIIGSVLIVCVGIWKGLPSNTIIALIASITGITWKLVEAIASEDNTARLTSRGSNVDVNFEAAPDLIATLAGASTASSSSSPSGDKDAN